MDNIDFPMSISSCKKKKNRYLILILIAVIAGKIILPKMAQYYTDNNQDMVNMATLQTNAEINRQKNKKKDKEEEWF